MASPIAESWIYATVLIRNEWGGSGTGFLVARDIDTQRGEFFLVTNKHVVNEDQKLRNAATTIHLSLNISGPEGKLAGKTFPVHLRSYPQMWREHPDLDIDVWAVDVTSLIVANRNITAKWVKYDLFVDSEVIKDKEITIREEVFIIGYPLGVPQGDTNFPLVRQGIIATRIGETIREPRKDGSITVLPAFRVDGGVVPGSSGSPVILKPVLGRFANRAIQTGSPPTYLLGIIATTRIAFVEASTVKFQSLAGLGLAFDATTIRTLLKASSDYTKVFATS